MGGKGSGRGSNEDFMKRSGVVQKQNPIADGMFLPNLSGDHSAGIVRATPTNNLDIPNKKYVDDSIATIDLSGYVPYTGATNTLNIGTNSLICGAIDAGGINAEGSSAYNFIRNSSDTVTTRTVINYIHKTSADMADPFGVYQYFGIEDDAAVTNYIVGFGAQRNGADNTGKFIISVANAGGLAPKWSMTPTLSNFSIPVQATAYYSSDGSVGHTATITTAKLTIGGSTGTMTFKNGLLVAHTDAT